jgi:hypothetical protein
MSFISKSLFSERVIMFSRISDEQRQSNLVLSPSSISTYLKSPAQFQWQYVLGNRPEQSQAMFEGEVLHKAILEPESFSEAFIVAEDKSTFIQTIDELKARIETLGEKPVKGKKGDLINQLLALDPSAKIWDVYLNELEESGKRIVSKTLNDTCLAVQNRIKGHSWLSKALVGGKAEQWAHFQFAEGVLLNMRMDFYNASHKQPIVLDVKTTRNASFESFQKEVWNNNLYVQAAIYVDAIEKITGVTPLFAWVVVEKEAPNPVEVYSADFGLLEAGRAVYHKTISKIYNSYKSDDWSYNQNKIVNLNLPAWAFNKLDHYAEGEANE